MSGRLLLPPPARAKARAAIARNNVQNAESLYTRPCVFQPSIRSRTVAHGHGRELATRTEHRSYVHRWTCARGAGVPETRLKTTKMSPNQICSEQSCSGDRFNPGGGWIFANASVLNCDSGSEDVVTLRVAIGNQLGAGR